MRRTERHVAGGDAVGLQSRVGPSRQGIDRYGVFVALEQEIKVNKSTSPVITLLDMHINLFFPARALPNPEPPCFSSPDLRPTPKDLPSPVTATNASELMGFPGGD